MNRRTNARPWLPCALAAAVALMAALVYLNALNNPFVYDDHRVVLENYSIRDLSNPRALLLNDVFRPVVNISYAVDYARSGLEPFGYHLTSLLLHMANVVLLFVLVRGLAGGDTAAGFAAAAVWAVHPLMVQAVGYVSGRSEVLCALFVLLSLLSLRAWMLGRGGTWMALGIGAWVLALASKETAAALPVVLLAYDRLLLRTADAAGRKRLARVSVPMLVFVAVAGLARFLVFAGVENVSRASFSWANIFVGLDVVRRYVLLAFQAVPQSIFHSAQARSSALPLIGILNVLLILGLGALAWTVRRRAPLITFGVLWFVLLLLPSVTLLVLDVGEPMAEQRAYLAGCGLAIAAGSAFSRLFAWSSSRGRAARAAAAGGLACLLLLMGTRTMARNDVWGDPVRLWKEAVASAPDVWLPHRGLGDALRDKGDFAGAAAAYAEAARLRPEEANSHLALGVSLLVTGRVEEADRALAEAARLSPGMVQAETARGMIARMTGRRDEARDRFLAVARAHPNAVLARQHLADMYENDYADPASALRMCREVQALAPQAEGVAECIRRNEQRVAAGAPAGRR